MVVYEYGFHESDMIDVREIVVKSLVQPARLGG